MISKELRRSGIGGSDVAAILGVDPRRDAFSVWQEKRGESHPTPATWRMKLGKIVERAIGDCYQELTGREIVWLDETQRSPVREWMVVTPDAVCLNELRGLDAKMVSWDQRHKWGDKPADVPVEYQLQVRYYMAALDYPVWDIAALIGMEEPVIYSFERDLEYEGLILDALEEFWQDYIVAGRQPPVGGSEASRQWLKHRFPRHREPLRKATEIEAAALDAYAQVRIEEKAAQSEKQRLENTLKLACGDGEGLEWPRGRFTWRATADSTATDWKALAASLLRTASEEDAAALIAAYTTPKPGTRRISFRCDEGGIND